MLAGYWGRDVSPDDISREIYLPQIRGTLNFELAAYADRWGFWTRQYRGTLDDLRGKIRAGVPVLVLGSLPGSRPEQYHYWIVTGYDDRRRVLLTHSGARPDEVIACGKFERLWQGAGHWSLLVCPPAAARWQLTADERNDLGLYFERRGDLDRAATEYRAALEQAPTNSWLHFNLGNVYLAQKKPAAAVASYQRALALDPNNADIYNNLAYAFAESGRDVDQAESLAQQAVRLRPAGKAAYLDTLGYIYLLQGKRDLARRTLEEALAATTDRQRALRATIRQRLQAIEAITVPK
jgi:tetratricopeptide (TPR) repeat protein